MTLAADMPLLLARLSLGAPGWWWVAVLGAATLVPLAWLALRAAGARDRSLSVALALRLGAVTLLLVCLLDPRWISRRASRGANFFAVVADNSQGLQVIDSQTGLDRAAAVRDALAGENSGWLARLSETFKLRPYLFDRGLQRIRDFSELNFQGDRTALGAALRSLSERYAGEPLAGILLVTDGNATDLTEGLPDLAGLPPIYPVLVGSPEPVRDLQLAQVDLRQTAFDDAPIDLRVHVAGSDLGSREVAVRVRELKPAAEESPPPLPDTNPPPQTVRLRRDGQPVECSFSWRPAGGGLKFYEAVVEPTEGETLDEATLLNNRRIVMVDRGNPQYRILYLAGRPAWEYKFFSRALQEDPQLHLVGLIRVADREPKFEFKGRTGEATNPLFRGFGRSEEETVRYDQPVLVRVNARDAAELRGGFPVRPEELFAYDAIVLDDVEAAFFKSEQLQLLRRFVSDRGGGLLMLGGADSLQAGGYAGTPLAAALPVYLDRAAAERPPGDFSWKLTREGWLEPWVRVRPHESEERQRLNAMPAFRVLNPQPAVKPGATVLATVDDQNENALPALVRQKFGYGRVAALMVGDLWRWGLRSEQEQADLARFWRQVGRWLVTDTPTQVTLQSSPGADDTRVLKVTARDAEYRPLDLANARVTVRRLESSPNQEPVGGSAEPPAFTAATLTAAPVPDMPGQFSVALAARDAGAYVAEAEVVDSQGAVVGRARTGWVLDPAADEFRSLQPNRALLQELARRTGGELVSWSELNDLAERLPARPAPITESWSFPVWHRSWVLLLILALFVAEWLWRRRRGMP